MSFSECLCVCESCLATAHETEVFKEAECRMRKLKNVLEKHKLTKSYIFIF